MTLCSVAKPMAFKVPQARALPTLFDLTEPLELTKVLPRDIMLEVGPVRLTRAGRELSRVCDSKPLDGFVDVLHAWWKRVQAR